jgi:hypothetical protein
MKGKCRFYTIESATLEYEAQLGEEGEGPSV